MITFNIGEQALLVSPLQLAETQAWPYIGKILTVISPLRLTPWMAASAYIVEATDGDRFWATPSVLQKLPTLREDLIRTAWANVPYFSRITAPKRHEVLA